MLLRLRGKVLDVPNRNNGGREASEELETLELCRDVRASQPRAEVDRRMIAMELFSDHAEQVVNVEALRKLAGSDHLHLHPSLRPTAWKLLLGYLPTERTSWEDELAASRLRYARLKKEELLNPMELAQREDYMSLSSNKEIRKKDLDGALCRCTISNNDHPLNTGNDSIWNRYFKNEEIAKQIDRDLQRTHPDIQFFSGDTPLSKSNRESMRNILLLFAKLNPAIGYVQGMHEVLAPLFYVFSKDPDKHNASNAEADSFGCFILLMSDFVDHFCQQLDNSPVGIHSTLSHLSHLLRANDEELWQHLEMSSKVKPQLYALRWIMLLLTQEFEFYSILRIWDSLLSSPLGLQEMLLRVCCAMLLCVRHELLHGDFTSNLKLLQHYPHQNISIQHLLEVAQQLKPTANLCSHFPPLPT